jgi:hypothetical protein
MTVDFCLVEVWTDVNLDRFSHEPTRQTAENRPLFRTKSEFALALEKRKHRPGFSRGAALDSGP